MQKANLLFLSAPLVLKEKRPSNLLGNECEATIYICSDAINSSLLMIMIAVDMKCNSISQWRTYIKYSMMMMMMSHIYEAS